MALPDLFEKLNPQQREAVTASEGPLLVIAGAGSGKTRVITHRIAHLIREKGIPAWQIFAATFTNKAAEEMRNRVAQLIPGAEAARLAISTFHSLCVGILRREGTAVGLTSRFTICDDGDQRALIKDCIRNLDVPLKPEQALHYISTAKVLMLTPEQAKEEIGFELGPMASQVYAQYQTRLLANDAVDFDDLLLHVVRIFKSQPEILAHYHDRWRYILVDEYQDTNRVQFEFVQLLAGKHGNICVVGDEDQSIYSWRGAEIENLLNFPQLFEGTQIIRLEQNYRSTETILQAASAVISHNRQRLGKELWSERGTGEPITLIAGATERDEAAQVVQTIVWLRKMFGLPLNDIAIFYRVNALSRVFEDQLRQRGLSYRVIGGIKFYERAEIKDLLCYLRLCVNPRDGIALGRILNKPTRGIGDKTLAKLHDDATRQNISLWDVLKGVCDARGELNKRAYAGICEFVKMVKAWGEFTPNHEPQEVLRRVLMDTQYEVWLGEANDLETISRRENVAELVSAIEEYHQANAGAMLEDYLERVALVSAQDEISDADAVSLMTLHTAKGLEYRAVFLAGLEDGIFPSKRAIDEGHYEEERRLFYVGITRAKDWLFMSRADSRNLYGRPVYNMPSQFLTEVPPELLRPLEETWHAWSEQGGARRGAVAGDAMRPGARDRIEELNRKGAKAQRGEQRWEQRENAEEIPEVQINGDLRGEKLDFEEAMEGAFPVGTRVTHPRLGAGEVIGVSGTSERRKVSVRFDAGIELEILEQYGGLTAEAGEAELPF